MLHIVDQLIFKKKKELILKLFFLVGKEKKTEPWMFDTPFQ